MENQQRIEQEELENLQKLQEKINNHLMRIGDLEAMKNEVLNDFQSVKAEYQEIIKQLEEKYGQVSINIKTGEITQPEE